VEDGATPHLLPESLRESKKTLAPESPSGKFPGQAGAPKSRHQGRNCVNGALSQGGRSKSILFRQELGGQSYGLQGGTGRRPSLYEGIKKILV
jgi:hypothetical protein